ncbi:hypothetical protein CGLO_06903 [Colletotrichum gloeosporioides Cg-14]|uniref:Uncharacterized protein n=1 Tax=Colletotrichum gloeosporioides (strain Cg-14) TaxID=1237896 RepID=T0KMW1_COLGC|nr:hypothetical protein CGLO_06903 [Colletotrichum gloeosporioides Cg-14]
MAATTRSASLRPQNCPGSLGHRPQRHKSQSQKPKEMKAEPKPVTTPKENACFKTGYIRIIITNCVATDGTASMLSDQLQALEPLVAKGFACKTFEGNSEKILIEAATCCEITAAGMGDFETTIQKVFPEASYEIHVRPQGGPPFLPYV